MNILEQTGKRLVSPTPKFWKKMLWLGGVLTTVSLGLMAAPESINIPNFLQEIAGYLATGGFVLTVVAQATTTDDNLSNQ